MIRNYRQQIHWSLEIRLFVMSHFSYRGSLLYSNLITANFITAIFFKTFQVYLAYAFLANFISLHCKYVHGKYHEKLYFWNTIKNCIFEIFLHWFKCTSYSLYDIKIFSKTQLEIPFICSATRNWSTSTQTDTLLICTWFLKSQV